MKTNLPIYVAVVLLIALAGASFTIEWPHFEIDPDLSKNVIDIILKYLLITLVFERAVAVYSIVRFDGKEKEILRRIRYFQKKISEYKKKQSASAELINYCDSDPYYKKIAEERPNDPPVINYLNLIEQNEVKREEVSGMKRKFSMRILMIVGVLVSVAGLSAFHDILNFPDQWDTMASIYQRGLTKFLDIVTTAALIGGGSSSLHRLFSTIQSALDKVKQRDSML